MPKRFCFEETRERSSFLRVKSAVVAALGSAGERAVQAVAARLIQVETVPIVATTPRLSVRIIGGGQCPKDATLRSISTFWIVRMSLTSLENLR